MASEHERCAHTTRVNRYSLMRGGADYLEGQGLEVSLDAGGEYDLLVLYG